MSVESRDGFDQRLELELRNHAAKHSGPSPQPAQARYNVGFTGRAARLSLVSTKAALAMIVIAAAMGLTGAEAAITGSANPADWGQRLVKQLQSCAAGLAPGSPGAGTCLSTFTRPTPAQAPTDPDVHGKAPSAPGTDPGTGKGGESDPNGGPPATHPGGGPPATHPGGGPPTSKPPKPTHPPGGGKPKTHVVGGPFGAAGPPNNHRPR